MRSMPDYTRVNTVSKLPLYAALGVPEIWRYDGAHLEFYELAGDRYDGTTNSRFLPGVTPSVVLDALEQSMSEGQSAALGSFRRRWPRRL